MYLTCSNRCVTFLLENRQKRSVYESGDVRLSQWNKVVVLKVVQCPVFTCPPLNRSWFGGETGRPQQSCWEDFYTIAL